MSENKVVLHVRSIGQDTAEELKQERSEQSASIDGLSVDESDDEWGRPNSDRNLQSLDLQCDIRIPKNKADGQRKSSAPEKISLEQGVNKYTYIKQRDEAAKKSQQIPKKKIGPQIGQWEDFIDPKFTLT